MSAKIFIDTNILLEIVHERDRFDEAIAFVRKHAGNVAISSLTVHLVMYFGRKVASRESLQQLLSDYEVLPLTQSEIDWAFTNIRDNDFEDALQLATAIHGGCDIFVTLDASLSRRYKTLPSIDVQGLK